MNTLLNQQGSGISQALGAVYATLARYCGIQPDSSAASGEDAPYAPLAQLVESFGLSRFERDLLLLCAGVEIDSRFAGALASLPPNVAPQGRPSFSRACVSRRPSLERDQPVERTQELAAY